ncbi:pumilio-like protein 24-like [Senna tora]|uniref:Pumilio-like protein 24-like n=1 Tax=Senna tora TaxID=362788 RepID=A0A834XEL8_9FABA|nr:pumilio-like protein 24-like [Senna tora]
MTSVIQPILEKGIVDHSIIHRLLMAYFSIAYKSSITDIIQQLSSPLLVKMIGTKDGAKLGILCVKQGVPRKKIIKGMKGHIDKIAYHQQGCMVLVCIISVVDDIKRITKAIIRKLQQILMELVLDKNGRRPLLQLLNPNCSHYFSPNDLAPLNSYIPSLFVKDHSEVSSQTETSKVEEPGDDEPKEDMEVTADEANKDGDK